MRGLFLYFFLIPVCIAAQKTALPEYFQIHPVDQKKSISSFEKRYIGSSDPFIVKNYLRDAISHLGNSTLILLNNTESRTGRHLLFQQQKNGIPVYRGNIKVNMDKQGNIISLFDNTYSFRNITVSENFPDSVFACGLYNNVVSCTKFYFFVSPVECVAIIRIEYLTSENQFMESLLDADHNVLYSRDMNVYFKPVAADSTVSAMVFLPDPLTTAGVTYGGLYKDNSDTDIPALNNQRVSVNMKVNYSGDTFSLQSPYVIIKDFAAPNVDPAISIGTPSFNYLRSQPEFENVNAYYHINIYQQYIQSLGFSNIVNYPIWVDTRGTTSDNSFFSPGYIPPRLTFGIGGVDDAEDADVIIHEYGHAMAYSAAPNTNTGVERTTLDEANSDYFAASYSRSINTFNWQNVYSWDGHNEFWQGRVVQSSKHYPEDLVNNLYSDADMWSSTLMQIWEDIGREETDATLIESLYGYANNMTMEDAAGLYMQADALLYAGKNTDVLCTHFYNRGLFSNCVIDPDDGKNVHVFNTMGFSDGNGAIIRFVNEVEKATFILYDSIGRKVFTMEKNNIKLFILKGDSYPKGVYILKVETPGETTSFRLVNN